MICTLDDIFIYVSDAGTISKFKCDFDGSEQGDSLDSRPGTQVYRKYKCKICGLVTDGEESFTIKDHIGTHCVSNNISVALEIFPGATVIPYQQEMGLQTLKK